MLKCLTLTQPWASLVAFGAKRIETRSWSTDYRGPLAIHAAKTWTLDDRQTCLLTPFRQVLTEHGITHTNQLPLGAIVAVANLVACAQVTDALNTLPNPERAFGNYAVGRYMWMLTDVRPLPQPLPCRGSLGLWTPDSETLDALKAQGVIE